MARPSPLEEDFLISLIVRTSRTLNERMRRGRSATLQPLTPVHLVTLSYVRENPDVTITDLGRHLNVTKQAAWDVVSTLEEQGVLTRVPHPTDGRARVLVPTDKCEELVEDGRKRWATLEQDLVATIGRERAAVVRDALVAYLEPAASDDLDESRPAKID